MIRTYSLQILKEHVDCILDPEIMQPVDTENNQMNQMTEIKKIKNRYPNSQRKKNHHQTRNKETTILTIIVRYFK